MTRPRRGARSSRCSKHTPIRVCKRTQSSSLWFQPRQGTKLRRRCADWRSYTWACMSRMRMPARQASIALASTSSWCTTSSTPGHAHFWRSLLLQCKLHCSTQTKTHLAHSLVSPLHGHSQAHRPTSARQLGVASSGCAEAVAVCGRWQDWWVTGTSCRESLLIGLQCPQRWLGRSPTLSGSSRSGPELSFPAIVSLLAPSPSSRGLRTGQETIPHCSCTWPPGTGSCGQRT